MKNFTYPLLILALILSGASVLHAQYITVTVAGLGPSGYSGDGGSARQARINHPTDVCVDAANNIYFVDAGNSVIRKVSAATGVITTAAGGGSSTADGVPATTASLPGLTKMAVDAAGNFYVSSSNKVRMVSTTGIITTIAGTGVAGYNGDGIAATSAQLNAPSGLCLDDTGNIYIADVTNGRIRKVTVATGLISSIASALGGVNSICMDASGNFFYANPSYIKKIAVGTGIVSSVGGYGITGIYADDSGNVYFNDASCGCHKIVVSTGVMSTVANAGGDTYNGDGGNSLLINFSWPAGMCMDAAHNIYIADKNNNRIRKVALLTHTPVYVYGKRQTVNACPDTITNIYSQLAVTDIDTLQNEIWTVLTSPAHGALSGFPAMALSGGRSSLSIPPCVFYAPSASYIGADSFLVRVTDGTFSDTMTIYMNVNYNPPDASFIYNPIGDTIADDTTYVGNPQKRFTVCIGHQLMLEVVTPGGTWSLDNGNATISTTGIITGVSTGTVTVTYSITNACGSSYATQIVTIKNCGSSEVGSVDESGIRVFPNPVSSVLNIDWNNLKAQHADVVIADVTGRVVMRSELQNNTGNGTTQLDLTSLNEGVYILNINSESEHYTSKVVVSRQ